MSMRPSVSIIVTCYNYGQYVADCLRSVQRQTFGDFEVIIIDDGSTDNSEQQIQPFLKDDRFRYIKQDNSGQANAKNRGIRESRAGLVAFLDADDLWVEKKLELQIPLFADHPQTGVVFSRVDLIDAEGNPLMREKPGKYLKPRRGRVSQYLVYDNFIPFSSVIVRKTCFEQLGCFDEMFSMGIDWDLWLRFSTMYSFDYYDEPLIKYRVGHRGQMSKNLLERFTCADKIIDKFSKKFPNVAPEIILKDAAYYSYCLRGYALRKNGLRQSLKFYLRAIVLFPCRLSAYLELFKAPLRVLLRR